MLRQRAQLEKISPLTSVDKITIPLLVATGGNDPRVSRKKENVDDYFWESMRFWRRMLLSDKSQ